MKFVRALLPWVAAAAGFILYLVTLNHWVLYRSLRPVVQAEGLLWGANLMEPLYYVLTYALHWLPASAMPMAFNLFSAVCATLTLALLARSVALLPHDRTHGEREKEQDEFALLTIGSAWLPPVLAVLLCGLQLTFWEHATAASTEMLNLLVFAYVIRCLLEYRIDERQSWLLRAALVYGLGITNNWAMIALFPLFLVALVWLRGLGFFNLAFLKNMFLCGSAGMLLYLWLPIVQSLSDTIPVSFWKGLIFNLGSQKAELVSLYQNHEWRWMLAGWALLSLVPILILSVRWPSHFGDSSRLGVGLATLVFHLLGGLFLIAFVWVALDPPFSPRSEPFPNSFPPFYYSYHGVSYSAYRPDAHRFAFLPFYYLAALSAGYFSGYFLLLFGKRANRLSTPGFLRLLNGLIISLVLALAILGPAMLIRRNLPQIRNSNGPLFRQLASLVTQSLPSEGGVVLSDDQGRTLLAETDLASSDRNQRYIFIDTGLLKFPDYHRYMKKRYGARWPIAPPNGIMMDPAVLQLVWMLSQSNNVYYLHPSFGSFFEIFHLEPHGAVYRLKSYSTNQAAITLSDGLVEENEKFWATADEEGLNPLLTALTAENPERQPWWYRRLFDLARLQHEANRDATLLVPLWSRPLDYWGVQLQRAGRLDLAEAHFKRALELNPENVAAQINLECNHNLHAGSNTWVEASKTIIDAFGPRYRTWDHMLQENGPFDQPWFCFEEGRVFAQIGFFRQATREFERCKELAPDQLEPRLRLAGLYLFRGSPDKSLKESEEIHKLGGVLGLGSTNQVSERARFDLLSVEMSARLATGDAAAAEDALALARRQDPTNQVFLAKAAKLFLDYGYASNGLQVIEQLLQLNPTNVAALINKGYACKELQRYDEATRTLSDVLSLEPTNVPALFIRATSYLLAQRLDQAQSDFESLQKSSPTAFQVYYGLGEIAYQRKDTNTAVRNYQLYMTNSPYAPREQVQVVLERLAALTGKSGGATNAPPGTGASNQ